VPWEHDFFVVTIRDLQRTASRVGLETVLVRKFSYPLEVIPKAARWAAKLLERPLRHVPWAWQFVLRRPRTDCCVGPLGSGSGRTPGLTLSASRHEDVPVARSQPGSQGVQRTSKSGDLVEARIAEGTKQLLLA